MRDVPLRSHILLQQQRIATHSDLGWLNNPLWFVFWIPAILYATVASVHWAPTNVLESEFERKHFNSGVRLLHRLVCGLTCMHIMLGGGAVCRSIGFHCTWPVGFIIITHFNEVAYDRTTRSLREMFHGESAKTATRWFSWGMSGIPNSLYKQNPFYLQG